MSLKVILQKTKKGEPTGKLILESANEKTKAPYNFKYAAAHAIVLTAGQIVDFCSSIKAQQAEINKITRVYAGGKVIKIEITEFGEKAKELGNPPA
jgi:hypothetical protein